MGLFNSTIQTWTFEIVYGILIKIFEILEIARYVELSPEYGNDDYIEKLFKIILKWTSTRECELRDCNIHDL